MPHEFNNDVCLYHCYFLPLISSLCPYSDVTCKNLMHTHTKCSNYQTHSFNHTDHSLFYHLYLHHTNSMFFYIKFIISEDVTINLHLFIHEMRYIYSYDNIICLIYCKNLIYIRDIYLRI